MPFSEIIEEELEEGSYELEISEELELGPDGVLSLRTNHQTANPAPTTSRATTKIVRNTFGFFLAAFFTYLVACVLYLFDDDFFLAIILPLFQILMGHIPLLF